MFTRRSAATQESFNARNRAQKAPDKMTIAALIIGACAGPAILGAGRTRDRLGNRRPVARCPLPEACASLSKIRCNFLPYRAARCCAWPRSLIVHARSLMSGCISTPLRWKCKGELCLSIGRRTRGDWRPRRGGTDRVFQRAARTAKERRRRQSPSREPAHGRSRATIHLPALYLSIGKNNLAEDYFTKAAVKDAGAEKVAKAGLGLWQ